MRDIAQLETWLSMGLWTIVVFTTIRNHFGASNSILINTAKNQFVDKTAQIAVQGTSIKCDELASNKCELIHVVKQ